MFRRCARLPIALAALLFALSPSTLKAEGRPTPASGRPSVEDAPAASLSAPALVARGTERFRRGNYDGAIAERDRTELLARVAEQRAKEAAALAKALEEERLRSELQGRPLAPPPPPPLYKRGWFWGLTAGGVGAVILTTTLVAVFARPPPEPATDLAPRRVLF